MANALTDIINTFKTSATAANTLAPVVPQVEAKLTKLEAEARATGEEIKEGAVIYGLTTVSLQLVSTIATCILAAVAVADYNRRKRN